MTETDRYDDANVLIDAAEDEWAWRARLRANPATNLAYRVTVFLVGLVLVAGGFALVPLPGPGWFIVFLGLAVWASEFEKAQAVKDWGMVWLRRWNAWILAQPWWMKTLVGLGTALFVGLVIWLTLRMTGIPGFVPDQVEDWMHANLHV
ncbi:MAG: PGPGW domain-containing protein [Nostocoides sp.]